MRLFKIFPISTALLLTLAAGCKVEMGTLKTFSADISLWNSKLSSEDPRWKTLPPGGWPAITCMGPEAEVSDCCQLPESQPQVDCQKTASECDETLNQCVLYFVYQEAATIDLLKEVPSLADQKNQVPHQVLLQSVTSSFTSDFQWPLPAVGMYVAPAYAQNIADPEAVFLGSIPPRNTTVTIDYAAQKAFSSYAVNFSTPFKLFFASTIKVASGPLPQGTLAVQVSGRIEADFRGD